ncbi:MAG TPA: uracil-DNA glycosylase, partial [Ignavibacteriaceae bacterium]
MDVKIEPSWKEVLKNEFTKPYFQQIVTFLKTEKAAGKIIYPPGPLIFNAFNQTPFTKLKVVLLGQDPYHGPGQAHGLSFSVPNGIKPPPSLVNIYKEIQNDIG